MTKRFDTTLNEIVDDHSPDWVAMQCARLGIPPAPFQILDTDLSVTLQPDKLFRLFGDHPAILHQEFESTGRLGWPAELLRYNTFAHLNHGLPVHSLIILLRPKANASDLTGEYSIVGCDGKTYLIFRYEVLRVWQESADAFLNAGVGLAPLALLTDDAITDLPGTFARFQQRLKQANLPPEVQKSLYGSTFVLCGLRHNPTQIEELYRSLSMTLEDSSTYQLILERGIEKGIERGAMAEVKSVLLRQGRKRFGDCPADVETVLRNIQDVAKLERLAENIFDVQSWDELLATP